jgi:hypothetical protein
LILLSDLASIDRHVVFIHGVRFGNTTVWLSSGKERELWPRWLVEDIPGLGVWSIEHDSAPTRWRGHRAVDAEALTESSSAAHPAE